MAVARNIIIFTISQMRTLEPRRVERVSQHYGVSPSSGYKGKAHLGLWAKCPSAGQVTSRTQTQGHVHTCLAHSHTGIRSGRHLEPGESPCPGKDQTHQPPSTHPNSHAPPSGLAPATPHRMPPLQLLQGCLHGLHLLEMAGHVCGQHHLNDQGPQLSAWREKER